MSTNSSFTIHTAPSDIKTRDELTERSTKQTLNASAKDVLDYLNRPQSSTSDEHLWVTKKGEQPSKEFIIHFRPGCPNTARAMGAIASCPNSFRVIFHSANHTTKNKKLVSYLGKNYPDTPITYPRVFSQFGELIGGATELIAHLSDQ